MDFIVLEGVKPWDGRYEFDLEQQPFTQREWGWLKRLANYMPLTIDDGWKGGDPELFGVFAVIALYRAGRIQADEVPDLFERLADLPFGATVRLETDQADVDEGDAGPPARSSGGSGNGSGDATRMSSEMWAPPGGIPASATSESPPVGSPT